MDHCDKSKWFHIANVIIHLDRRNGDPDTRAESGLYIAIGEVDPDKDVQPAGEWIFNKHPRHQDIISLYGVRGRLVAYMAEIRPEVLHSNYKRHGNT